jgi:calcineurin-like phosphoesterase family protein
MHLYHGRANAIHPYNNLLTQTEDVLCNPQNPVNPDSKLIFTGILTLKPVEEKTRGNRVSTSE